MLTSKKWKVDSLSRTDGVSYSLDFYNKLTFPFFAFSVEIYKPKES